MDCVFVVKCKNFCLALDPKDWLLSFVVKVLQFYILHFSVRLGQGPYFKMYFVMKILFLRITVNSTIILAVIATTDVFLPKTTVIFAQGDTKAGTVGFL